MTSQWQYFHESCPVCGGNVATKSKEPFVVNVGDMAMCQTCSLIGAIELDPNDQDSVFVSWDLDDVYQEAKIIGYNDLDGKNHYNFYSGDSLIRKALVEGYEAGKEHRSEHEHAIATDPSIEYRHKNIRKIR